MDKRKLIIAGVVLVLALGGTGAVLAASGDDDRPLRGATYDKAAEAALDHVGEGTVIETEQEGDGYGVEIRKDDGSVVEVELDQDFNVTGTEADDDSGEDEGSDDDDGAGDDD